MQAHYICLNLYDKKINSREVKLKNNSKFEIPEKTFDNREYKYISIILEINLQFHSKFISAAEILMEYW